MSTRDDARLTDQERAALSSLEELANAADPQLADRLRGPGRWSAAPLRSLRRLIGGRVGIPDWVHSLRVAVPTLATGLLLVVFSLSIAWQLGVVGAVLAAAGLAVVAHDVARRFSSRTGPSA